MANGNGNDISKFTKWIKLISYIVILVATIGGGYWWLTGNFVSANDFNKAETTITMNSRSIQSIRIENYIRRAYERIWMLEKQFGVGCANCPPEYRQEHNKLKLDIDNLKRRLKKLES
jgi:5,10-methylenetetrahydrofolate reductase